MNEPLTKIGTPRKNKPGAGRPETGRIRRAIGLRPERWDDLRKLAEHRQITQVEAMEQAISAAWEMVPKK